MPKHVDEPRTHYAQATVTREEREALEALAREERQTLSTVLRDLILEALAAREAAEREGEGRGQ